MEKKTTLLDAYEAALKKAKQENVTMCIVHMPDGTYEVGTAATVGYLFPTDEYRKSWIYGWMTLATLIDSAGDWRTA